MPFVCGPLILALCSGLSVSCVLYWVLCGCPFSFCFRFLGLGLVMVTPTCSGRLTVAPRSGLFDFGSLDWLSGLGLDCLIFLGLAFRVVLLDSWVAIGLGSLRVCWPRFFKFRAWSWVLWSWIPDCKLTSPGSWWPALFGLECLNSGLLSWLSG